MKQLISNGSSNASGAKAGFEFEQHKSKKSSKSNTKETMHHFGSLHQNRR